MKIYRLIIYMAIYILFSGFGFSEQNSVQKNYPNASDNQSLLPKQAESFYQEDFNRTELLKYQDARDYWERDNNIKSSIREFEEYIELYKNGKHLLKAYQYLIRLYRIQREFQKAIKIYKKLFEKFLNNRIGVEAKLEMCRLESLIGNEKKAKKCFEIILVEYPRFEDLTRQATTELFLLNRKFIKPPSEKLNLE